MNQFVRKLVWSVVRVGLLLGFFTWWSWLWHERCNYLRSRCDYMLGTLRDITKTSILFWPDDLREKVEDLVRHGWGAPR